MDCYVNQVLDAIEEYKKLIDSKNPKDGYGLEKKSALIWDTLEYMLKGYIDTKLYKALEKEWVEVLEKVYSNKNLCIC